MLRALPTSTGQHKRPKGAPRNCWDGQEPWRRTAVSTRRGTLLTERDVPGTDELSPRDHGPERSDCPIPKGGRNRYESRNLKFVIKILLVIGIILPVQTTRRGLNQNRIETVRREKLRLDLKSNRTNFMCCEPRLGKSLPNSPRTCTPQVNKLKQVTVRYNGLWNFPSSK